MFKTFALKLSIHLYISRALGKFEEETELDNRKRKEYRQ